MSVSTTNQFRVEEDALGEVYVPAEHLWGAQTQRSHMNFPIGVERFRWGRTVVRALGILKNALPWPTESWARSPEKRSI
jgi:fumarate hydratase class II